MRVQGRARQDERIQGGPYGVVEAETTAIERHLVDILFPISVHRVREIVTTGTETYSTVQASQQTLQPFIRVDDLDAVQHSFV